MFSIGILVSNLVEKEESARKGMVTDGGKAYNEALFGVCIRREISVQSPNYSHNFHLAWTHQRQPSTFNLQDWQCWKRLR